MNGDRRAGDLGVAAAQEGPDLCNGGASAVAGMSARLRSGNTYTRNRGAGFSFCSGFCLQDVILRDPRPRDGDVRLTPSCECLSDERPSDVLGALPRRRPHRRSDKRPAPAPEERSPRARGSRPAQRPHKASTTAKAPPATAKATAPPPTATPASPVPARAPTAPQRPAPPSDPSACASPPNPRAFRTRRAGPRPRASPVRASPEAGTSSGSQHRQPPSSPKSASRSAPAPCATRSVASPVRNRR